MAAIYLIHGFTGAGKTTFSKKFEKDISAVRYSPDEWMSARHGANPPAEFFAQYLAQIKQDILADAKKNLDADRDVIFDYGFWKRAERDEYRAIAKDWGVTCNLLWIKADDTVMERRVLSRTDELPDGQLVIDKNAIEEFRKRFDPLQDDETHRAVETTENKMTQKLFLEDSYLQSFDAVITAVSENGVQFDKTIFYATSGGQPGDAGVLKIANQNVPVVTTKKGEGFDDVWHILPEDAAEPKVGDVVSGQIDWETRYKHMRMHTCLHLLCSLIVGNVTGGSVGAEKGRLDFDLPAGALDKDDLNLKLNKLIEENHPVSTEWITDDELDAKPDLVRTMSVKPPSGSGKIRLVRIGAQDNPVDLQPCGGTHVKSTGEIGRVEIVKIENKGKQNRRISVVFA